MEVGPQNNNNILKGIYLKILQTIGLSRFNGMVLSFKFLYNNKDIENIKKGCNL